MVIEPSVDNMVSWLPDTTNTGCVDGDLSHEASPQALARYLATLHQGMSVQATSGASKKELLHVATLAMKAGPS